MSEVATRPAAHLNLVCKVTSVYEPEFRFVATFTQSLREPIGLRIDARSEPVDESLDWVITAASGARLLGDGKTLLVSSPAFSFTIGRRHVAQKTAARSRPGDEYPFSGTDVTFAFSVDHGPLVASFHATLPPGSTLYCAHWENVYPSFEERITGDEPVVGGTSAGETARFRLHTKYRPFEAFRLAVQPVLLVAGAAILTLGTIEWSTARVSDWRLDPLALFLLLGIGFSTAFAISRLGVGSASDSPIGRVRLVSYALLFALLAMTRLAPPVEVVVPIDAAIKAMSGWVAYAALVSFTAYQQADRAVRLARTRRLGWIAIALVVAWIAAGFVWGVLPISMRLAGALH